MALVTVNNGSRNGNWPALPSLWNELFGNDWPDSGNMSSTGTTLPAVNIVENGNGYKVEVAAPGMKKEDFNVELDNDLLVVSSEKEDQKEEEKGNYSRREFYYQSFKRSFTLPNTVDAGKISAQYKDGILTLVIPKKEEAKVKPARRIEIN